MARKQRVQFAGAIDHVTLRGVERLEFMDYGPVLAMTGAGKRQQAKADRAIEQLLVRIDTRLGTPQASAYFES
jgi:hypothetical protein